MIHSICLFFILLCLQNTVALGQTNNPYNKTTEAPVQKQTIAPASYEDEWEDFDDEEEVAPQPTTRWGRFMQSMDKTALQLKALYHFKLKPWWQEKHGKEITIGTASALAAIAAAYYAYRSYQKKIHPYFAVAKAHQFDTSTATSPNPTK